MNYGVARSQNGYVGSSETSSTTNKVSFTDKRSSTVRTYKVKRSSIVRTYKAEKQNSNYSLKNEEGEVIVHVELGYPPR